MASTLFDQDLWYAACQQRADNCLANAFTPMHQHFLFSQAVDEALTGVPQDKLAQAIAIAQGFGYESWQERNAFVDWLAHQGPQGASS